MMYYPVTCKHGGAYRPLWQLVLVSHVSSGCLVFLQWFLDEINAEPLLNLVGVHSHLGSTITKVSSSPCADTSLTLVFWSSIRPA